MVEGAVPLGCRLIGTRGVCTCFMFSFSPEFELSRNSIGESTERRAW